ncbi:hypothetical protein chiPu_0011583 [Chiloscyllium punctatum]|uniref:Torsin family 2 member A n=1 Tax=Chiloscyllium punctatum TaxID=137246 RepID=A0A401SRW0_CHIPU|nr:hypothetical protein [Chiloscyllium punctatum]
MEWPDSPSKVQVSEPAEMAENNQSCELERQQLQDSEMFPWSFLCWEVTFPFRSVYCQLSDSCDCAFQPRIDHLELDLCRHVYGQHVAKEVIVEAVKQFLAKQSPVKPLVLSFHGWSGTGKSYVTALLMRNLYRNGMKSSYVHQFVPTLHFPHACQVDTYKEQLESWISGNLSDCSRSVFIFDEMDKMHPGLIDAIKPFLGSSHVMYGTNYRKAIFIFVSNAGGGFWNSTIINEQLVDYFVPFLPLKLKHVKECVRSEMVSRGIKPSDEIVAEVAKSMNFIPESEKLFSQTGCKTVSAKLDFFL